MSHFELIREGDHVRVVLGVKLTALEVPELQAALLAELSAGAREVTVDMRTTTMLDSTGIGLLIAINNSLNAAQGRMAVVEVSSEIFGLLRSMRLVERLHAQASGGTANG